MDRDRPITTDCASRSSTCAPAPAGSGANAAAASSAGYISRRNVPLCVIASCRSSQSSEVSGSQAFANERANLRHGNGRGCRIAPRLVLDLAFLEPTVANRNAVRYANQLEVCKHHARALPAVVEQHLDAGRRELVV